LVSSLFAEITDILRSLSLLQWLYEDTGNSLDLGILGVVSLFAHVPAILYGGLLADTIDPKNFMACAQLLSALTSLAVCIFMWTETFVPWKLYIVAFFADIVQVWAKPCRSVMLAIILPPREVPQGVSIHQLVKETAKVSGPLLFYWLAPGTSSLLPLFVTSLGLSLVNIVLPYFILTSGTPVTDVGNSGNVSKLQLIWEGLVYVVLGLVCCCACICSAAYP
jgi:sugar phosphate permease